MGLNLIQGPDHPAQKWITTPSYFFMYFCRCSRLFICTTEGPSISCSKEASSSIGASKGGGIFGSLSISIFSGFGGAAFFLSYFSSGFASSLTIFAGSGFSISIGSDFSFFSSVLNFGKGSGISAGFWVNWGKAGIFAFGVVFGKAPYSCPIIFYICSSYFGSKGPF